MRVYWGARMFSFDFIWIFVKLESIVWHGKSNFWLHGYGVRKSNLDKIPWIQPCPQTSTPSEMKIPIWIPHLPATRTAIIGYTFYWLYPPVPHVGPPGYDSKGNELTHRYKCACVLPERVLLATYLTGVASHRRWKFIGIFQNWYLAERGPRGWFGATEWPP